MSVRDRIRLIQKQLRDGALTPDMARESLVQLTALFGHVLDEARESEIEHAGVEVAAYAAEGTANRAKLAAKVHPSYRRMREAKDAEKLVTEMIRSCKVYLKSLDTELQLAR